MPPFDRYYVGCSKRTRVGRSVWQLRTRQFTSMAARGKFLTGLRTNYSSPQPSRVWDGSMAIEGKRDQTMPATMVGQ
jgi:hypothetical protein